MTTRSLIGLTVVVMLAIGAPGSYADPPPPILLEPVLSGLSSPILVTNARDGSDRLFIVEQGGIIKVLQPEGTTPTVFLDITTKVLSGGERGLLGLTFHPQFTSNGRFFVNYTRQTDGATVIAEYKVLTTGSNVADPTETVILVVDQPFANHNGGMVEFGPDGFLYIALGDGGSGNDPGNRSQDVTQLLGKILRIDVDHPGAGLPYSSPPSNPFFGSTMGADEIYAYGFRNPWRFSFDRGTGQLYVGDVGQGQWEEIDIVTLGGNYGWRIWEASACSGVDPALCNPAGFIFPIAEYKHLGGRCSVTGGYVYRGVESSLPLGSYVYADFCSGEIFVFQNGTSTVALDTGLNISAFGEDESGELYVVNLGGTIHRIIGATPPAPPIVTPAPGSTLTSTTVTFTGGHTGADLQHGLFVGTTPGASNLAAPDLGTGHAATVSGLPTSGTIYVTYWTRFATTSWQSTSQQYTMNAGGAFNYTLTNTGGITVSLGTSGSTTITATIQAGTPQTVSFGASGLPSGATASFSAPGACSPTCSTTLTIATVASTPTGTFPITVTGSPLGRTTTFNLVVKAPVSPPIVTPAPGSTLTTTTVTFTGGHTSEDLQHGFFVGTTPGAANIFASDTGTSHAVTVSGLPTSGTIYVTYWTRFASTSWQSTSQQYTMSAGGAFDYTLTNGGAVTVSLGTSGGTTITATLAAGTTQAVSFAASGLPSGATASFTSPGACSPTCSTTVTIATGASTPTGTFPITVTGSPVGRTTTFNLVVNPPVTPRIVSPAPGSTLTSTTVTFTGGHTNADLQHSLFVGTSPTASNIFASDVGANHAVTVSGLPTSGIIYVTYWTRFASTSWQSSSQQYLMNVSGAFDYTLTNNGGITVSPGASGGTTITATLAAGTTQAVSFGASGLPSGATASFTSPGACSPTCSTTLTIATGTSTPTGTFPITVTGSPLGRTTTLNLVVRAPVAPPIVTPAPGSTLTTTTVTFTGGHTSEDLQHGLFVGTTPGAANIFGADTGTSHAVTVSGLPTSGTIYVTYWTRFAGTSWQSTSQQYTMSASP